jgi:hypothetical protein
VDWLTFLAAMVKALAWPAVVVVALLVLKRNIGDLLRSLGERLEKAKGAGIELTFGKGVDQVEEILPAPEAREITGSISSGRMEAVSAAAHLPPAYIVSQAWLKLDQAIRAAVAVPQQSPGVRRAAIRITDYIEAARRQGILEADEVPGVQQLRELRNQAAHFADPGITITDALRYQDIAEALIEKIEHRSRDRPPD